MQPTTLSPTTTSTMASTLLCRQLARASQRLTSPTLVSSLTPRRAISITAVRQFASPVDEDVPRTHSGRKVIDTHIAEDLHGMSASDVLAEHSGRPEAQMRHFTGTHYFVSQPVHCLNGLCDVNSKLRVSSQLLRVMAIILIV